MPTPLLEELNGEVLSTKRFDSGYTILRLEVGKGSIATLVGSLPPLAEGVVVHAMVEKTEHPIFGLQYKVHQIEERGFSSVDGVINYLSGPAFEGIGKAMARLVADHLGAGALTILDEDPEKIFGVVGLPQNKAQIILESWKADRAQHKLMSLLMQYGITVNTAMKIHAHFDIQAAEIVQKEPYRLTEVGGIGFTKADEIALKIGISRTSNARVEAAVMNVMEGALMQGGNCYMGHQYVAEAAVALLLNDVNILAVGEAIKRLTQTTKLVVNENRIYLSTIYEAEKQAVAHLKGMLAYEGRVIYSDIEALERDLDALGISKEIQLAPEQKEALLTAMNNRVCIMTGSPGTGKTTITRALCQLMEHHGIKFSLCSPTGRAAKRMMESTGREAKTIHRLLKVSPTGGFEFNISNPLSTDCLIVDEVSMLDVLLFRHLLAALEENDRLVLIGDADQLPSVGPGSVLRDMIKSGRVPLVRLSRIFRQDAGSAITLAARDIIQGTVPNLVLPSQAKGKNFMFAGAEKIEDVIGIMLYLVTKTLQKIKINGKNLSPDDIQVLTPMREKGLGINDLNPRLQEVLNPPDPKKDEVQAGMYTSGPRIFRVGDRVMQVKNDYEKQVFNGNIGTITGINKASSPVLVGVQFQDATDVTLYKPHDLDDLTHAYACTVHKSQGGEFPAVIMICHNSQRNMLQRNLFYTGVTRAKKVCIVIGTESAVETAVNNAKEQHRNTTVAEMLAK